MQRERECVWVYLGCVYTVYICEISGIFHFDFFSFECVCVYANII